MSQRSKHEALEPWLSELLRPLEYWLPVALHADRGEQRLPHLQSYCLRSSKLQLLLQQPCAQSSKLELLKLSGQAR